jgi:hypothetical protein
MQPFWRHEVWRLTAYLDTNLIFVEYICKEETIRSMLKQRETTLGLSNARLEHLSQMIEDFAPLVELPGEIHLKMGTDQPLTPCPC